jgi:hypothetical protein
MGKMKKVSQRNRKTYNAILAEVIKYMAEGYDKQRVKGKIIELYNLRRFPAGQVDDIAERVYEHAFACLTSGSSQSKPRIETRFVERNYRFLRNAPPPPPGTGASELLSIIAEQDRKLRPLKKGKSTDPARRPVYEFFKQKYDAEWKKADIIKATAKRFHKSETELTLWWKAWLTNRRRTLRKVAL